MKAFRFPLTRKRYFALTGDRDNSVLAEVIRVSGGQPIMQELATVEGSLDDKVTLNRLLAKTTEIKGGDISVALPLNFFEIASVTLPMIKEEAVGRALPYHLAKVIDRPLGEYIYDWQITRRHKENIEVTVYLFPAKTYNAIKKEFGRRQLTIKYLEADVFAAFAYLGICGRMDSSATTVCALIWPHSLSLALYADKQLKLVRNIKLAQPDADFCLPTAVSDLDEQSNGTKEQITMPDDLSLAADDDDNASDKDPAAILSEFSLLSKTDAETTPETEAEISPPPTGLSLEEALSSPDELAWQDYLQEIILEIIRSRDYFTSVAKGSQVGNIIIGGADVFWSELQSRTQNAVDLPVDMLIADQFTGDTSHLLKAICIGTGSRW